MKDSFKSLGLSEATLSAVERIGYRTPTAVQEKTIPVALRGHDVVVGAKTGTGKTAAFALPIIDRLGHARKSKAPAVLVLTPTRELARQIETVFAALTKTSKIRTASVIGGVAYQGQIRQLERGVDILVATPGRLIDIMERGTVDLKKVETLVLDEADRMLDMGFLPAIKKIIAQVPDERQTMLFSATIDKGVLENISGVLCDPRVIEVSARGETAETVDQLVIPVDQRSKPQLLRSVLERYGSSRVIVFARTKRRTDACARQLCEAGYCAEAIHSEKSQRQRQQSLNNFTKGKTEILVATDVLARGIDVTNVEFVINYDLPDSPDDYVHRIGRTGRAGENGNAISFVSSESRGALVDIERLVGKKIPNIDPEILKVIFNKGGAEQSFENLKKKPTPPKNKGGNAPHAAKKKSSFSAEHKPSRNKKRRGNAKSAPRKGAARPTVSRAAR